ncbi:hypothetical protein [Dictyobacter arantiisoli]|uniref:Uncharacterized protein n=1 Tax=Dictyobacter arantiisoli TaxID=2014874 RepID=A0A5A5TG67_9CHLR|nr:hypothetical protein [Dictyobacter arantiisoli]GCF09999.1 hypothetical protein KDI_35630 [Dictyobacter arantiisoli]
MLPVLCSLTFSIFCILILRQMLTARENQYLLKSQAQALSQLEEVHKQLEIQTQSMEMRRVMLEAGIQHLKYVQASLANGNFCLLN